MKRVLSQDRIPLRCPSVTLPEPLIGIGNIFITRHPWTAIREMDHLWIDLIIGMPDKKIPLRIKFSDFAILKPAEPMKITTRQGIDHFRRKRLVRNVVREHHE